MNPTTEVVRHQAQLGTCLDSWRRLAGSPMQSPEWMLGWWAAYGSPASSLSVVVVRRGQRVIGLAPFYLRGGWCLGRTLRFLGSGKACSDFQTLLAESGEEKAVASSVADWLTTAGGEAGWDAIELDGVCRRCPAISHLLGRLDRYECILESSQLESTWRLDLTGGWDGFLSRQSKTQRRQSRNLTNRFEKSAELSYRTASTPESIPDALAICIDLHQKRWNAVGKPGCFVDPRFEVFLERASAGLARHNQFEVTVLEEKGKPLAAQIFLRDVAGGAYLYQTGRDPDKDAARVGRILNLISIKRACAAGIQSIDYLRGDEIYKSRLGAQPAECWRLRAIAPSPLPRLRHTAWSLGQGLKQHAKSLTRLVDHALTPSSPQPAQPQR